MDAMMQSGIEDILSSQGLPGKGSLWAHSSFASNLEMFEQMLAR